MATTAQQIAARYRNDGQVWRDDSGVELDHACRAAGAAVEYRDGHGTDTYRYDFADGSCITVAGPAWDFGYPICYCCHEEGHTQDCVGAQ